MLITMSIQNLCVYQRSIRISSKSSNMVSNNMFKLILSSLLVYIKFSKPTTSAHPPERTSLTSIEYLKDTHKMHIQCQPVQPFSQPAILILSLYGTIWSTFSYFQFSCLLAISWKEWRWWLHTIHPMPGSSSSY